MKRYGIVIGLLSCVWHLGLGYDIYVDPKNQPNFSSPSNPTVTQEVEPTVQPPVGEVPMVIDPAATRYAPPNHNSANLPQSKSGASGVIGMIEVDSKQVIQEASRTEDSLLERGLQKGGWFLGFLLLGIGSVFGLVRWLSTRLPEPPRPTRRRRF